MKTVVTWDGSQTLRSLEYNENYHSLAGAREECIKKYVEPCKIKERKFVRILDYCFGMGYNAAAAIDFCDGVVDIIGLEKDPYILACAQDIEYPFSCKEIILKAIKDGEYQDAKVHLRILVGDARVTIKQTTELFDVVFFDPFSPKVCPELWTFEVFADIFARMSPGGILATYSCARVARDNMRKAGFIVSDGIILGRRGPATLATKP